MHISERESQLPERIIGKLLKLANEDKSVISLGAGEPDFPAPPKVVSYAKKMLPKSNHYSPPEGRRELREAIAKKAWKENKIKCTPEDIVITNGSQEALILASASMLDVSERVLLPNPCFMSYVPLLEILNIFPVLTALDENFMPDVDEMRKSVTKKTKVILINTPSNPTGAVYSKKLLEEIANLAVEKDLFVFSDEAYEKIIYEAKHISIGSLNGMKNRVATFQTFSKSYAMCGYRLGYVIAPSALSKAMKKVHIYSTISAPTLSQFAGLQALKEKTYIRKMVKEYDRRRRMIVSRLNNMGLETKMPQGAFYAFSDISNIEKNSVKFALKLLKKKKVAVVPGSEFGPAGEGYIRLSYASAYDKIKKAMDRLEQFVRKY
jgi:aminotransferase